MNKPDFDDFSSKLTPEILISYFKHQDDTNDEITNAKLVYAFSRMLRDYHEWLMKELED